VDAGFADFLYATAVRVSGGSRGLLQQAGCWAAPRHCMAPPHRHRAAAELLLATPPASPAAAAAPLCRAQDSNDFAGFENVLKAEGGYVPPSGTKKVRCAARCPLQPPLLLRTPACPATPPPVPGALPDQPPTPSRSHPLQVKAASKKGGFFGGKK
jgi:hypothetical protein